MHGCYYPLSCSFSGFSRRYLRRPNKKHFTRSEMAGLFFCLASAEGAGLLFFHAAIQPHTSVYSAFCPVHAVIPPAQQNSAHGFTAAFPAIDPFKRQQYQTCTGGYNTTCTTLESITAPGRPPAHTRYHRHARTLHRSAQPPYYNTAYKRVQHTADHASPAGSAPAVCGLLTSANGA